MNMMSEAIEYQKLIAEMEAEGVELSDEDKTLILESETTLAEKIEWLIKKRKEDMAHADALGNLIEDYTKRRTSFVSRANSKKDFLHKILNITDQKKIETALGIAYIRKGSTRVEIESEDLIPDEFKLASIKIDRRSLEKAIKNGQDIMGASIVQSPDFIVIR